MTKGNGSQKNGEPEEERTSEGLWLPIEQMHERLATLGVESEKLCFQRYPSTIRNFIGEEGEGWKVSQTLLDVKHGGKGVTIDRRQAKETRERAYWGRLPKPPV